MFPPKLARPKDNRWQESRLRCLRALRSPGHVVNPDVLTRGRFRTLVTSEFALRISFSTGEKCNRLHNLENLKGEKLVEVHQTGESRNSEYFQNLDPLR